MVVSTDSGVQEFVEDHTSTWRCCLAAKALSSQRKLPRRDVEARSISDILRKYRPTVVKMDIEVVVIGSRAVAERGKIRGRPVAPRAVARRAGRPKGGLSGTCRVLMGTYLPGTCRVLVGYLWVLVGTCRVLVGICRVLVCGCL